MTPSSQELEPPANPARFINARREALVAQTAQTAEQERSALKEAQNRFTARFMRVVDVTGKTRIAQDHAWEELNAKHEGDAAQIAADADHSRDMQEQAIKAQHAAAQVEAEQYRTHALRSLEDRHSDQAAAQEQALQEREQARELARVQMQEQINNWKAAARAAPKGEATPTPPRRRAANDSAVQPAQDFDRSAAPQSEPKLDKADQEEVWRQRERERQWEDWADRSAGNERDDQDYEI